MVKAFFRPFIVMVALAVLAGCSTSSSKSDEPRQLHVTLVGGSHLNVSASGAARPIQVCLYVVRAADWLPTPSGDDSSCMSRGQDSTVVAESRHVIAPAQVSQFSLDLPRSGELWLVTDADYARRPPNYTPLRIRVEGRGLIHQVIWLDRDGIYNASLPGPVPIGRVDDPQSAHKTKAVDAPRRNRQ